MHLTATDFEATYRVRNAFRLPSHSGSLLRGVLGRALRRASCPPSTPCPEHCLHPSSCAYTRLFDPPTPSPPPHHLLRGATRAPQPLIPLFPAPGRLSLAPDTSFSFGLRILGQLQSDTLDRLLLAAEHLAEFHLGDEGGRLEFISFSQRGQRNRSILPAANVPSAEPRLRIVFETPVWLARKGRPIPRAELDFSTLFHHAYRRLTTLSALYGELTTEDDQAFQELRPLAPEVRVVERRLRPLRWERLSEEQGVRHLMMGMIGDLLFEGHLGPFLPVLQATALVHLGKGTSHGLGRIRLDPLP